MKLDPSPEFYTDEYRKTRIRRQLTSLKTILGYERITSLITCHGAKSLRDAVDEVLLDLGPEPTGPSGTDGPPEGGTPNSMPSGAFMQAA